jgi:hypothetical protein
MHDTSQLRGLVGRKLDVLFASEIDDGGQTEGSVEMYVEIGFGEALKELERKVLGARVGHS